MALVGFMTERNRAVLYLGEPLVRLVCNQLGESRSSNESQEPIPAPPPRLIPYNRKLWAVGKKLQDSMGKRAVRNATHDEALCRHPSTQMQAQGNGKGLYWMCKACVARWERIGVTDPTRLNHGFLTSADLVTFGKHTGYTYLEVYQMDKQYCDWVLDTASGKGDCCDKLRRFARWIAQKELELEYQIPLPVYPEAAQGMEEDL